MTIHAFRPSLGDPGGCIAYFYFLLLGHFPQSPIQAPPAFTGLNIYMHILDRMIRGPVHSMLCSNPTIVNIETIILKKLFVMKQVLIF